jgi:hypothetical protein
MESGQVHPIFAGILRGVMVGQNDYFAARYERKEVSMDDGQQLARDRAEGTLEARKIQDAKADFRFESARDDYLRDLRAERLEAALREAGDAD